jgi:hypothetical protein
MVEVAESCGGYLLARLRNGEVGVFDILKSGDFGGISFPPLSALAHHWILPGDEHKNLFPVYPARPGW